MYMDILVFLIFALVIFFSMRRGFMACVANFSRGLVSVVVAYLFCDRLAEYIINETPIGDSVSMRIASHLTDKYEGSATYMTLPEIFKSGANSISSDIISSTADKLAFIAITILSFAAILFGLKFLLGFFVLLIKKSRNRRGFTGTIDRFLGLLLGMASAIFYVYLFFALLFPLVGVFSPGSAPWVMGLFNGSVYAQDLYDNNLILLLFKYLLK